MTNESDLVAIAAICISIPAAFLGILLPIYYSISSELTDPITDSFEDLSPSLKKDLPKLRRYVSTSDTLLNLAAVFWAISIVLELCLIVARISDSSNTLLGKIIICSVVLIPISFFMILVYGSFRNSHSEYSIFSISSSSKIRNIVGLLINIGILYLTTILTGYVFDTMVAQPTESNWNIEVLVRFLGFMSAGAVIPVLIWIYLTIHFTPFQIACKLKSNSTSTSE